MFFLEVIAILLFVGVLCLAIATVIGLGGILLSIITVLLHVLWLPLLIYFIYCILFKR